MTLRQADSSDLNTLHVLDNATAARPWSRASLASALASRTSEAWLWEEECTPVGYVLGQRVLDEAEIHAIGILPEARRAGHGGRLLDGVLHAWKVAGVHQVHLEVREDNVAARNLYTSRGFRPNGRRTLYYGDVDALLFCWCP